MNAEQLENNIIAVLFGGKERKIYTEEEIDECIDAFAKLPMYAKVTDEEIELIKELRKHINIYSKLIDDPKRMLELIDKKVR
jgi:1-aminocyclopropane-1-carboxylate deaminase/D-cysteine desulfhydrase-like pyridoxal-dependent ACC family enzyme